MEESDDQNSEEKTMAPRNNDEPEGDSNTNLADDDLQEMRAVNESLDDISIALDFFEQRTDNIIEQLKELLHSNREIRMELAMAKAAAAGGDHSDMGNDNTNSNQPK